MTDQEEKELREDLEEERALRERLAKLLEGVALGLKGPPPENVWHDWSGLPALAKKARAALEEIAEGNGCNSKYGPGCDTHCKQIAYEALWIREKD